MALRSTVGLAFVFLAFTACSSGDSPTQEPAPVATSITLSPTGLSFASLGQTQQLTATVRDQSGTVMAGAAVVWTASAPTVADVSSSGLVTAVGNGTATVTATSGLASAGASVTVQQVPTALALSVPPSTMAQNRIALVTQPVVELRDARGRPVAQAGVVVTASVPQASGLRVTGEAAASTSATGKASYSKLTLAGKVGRATLMFSAPGLAGDTAAVTITPGSPAILVRTVGDDQNGTVGLAVPVAPMVRVLDGDSNAVPGQEVRFTNVTGGGSVGVTAVVTDSAGRASSGTWIMGPAAGPNTLRAGLAAEGVEGNPASFWAYAFPTFAQVTVPGPQPSFATGVTFNRSRDKMTLAQWSWGIGELAPEGGQWLRYGTSVPGPGGGRLYAAVHEARQQVVTVSDAGGAAYWSYQSEAWVTVPAGDVPAARQFPAMVYDSLRGRVLLYGGIITGGSSNPVGELYAWDGDRWTRLPDPPAGNRAGHRMAVDPSSGRIYVHGGVDLGNPLGGRALTDTWVLNPDGTWEKLDTQHPRPLAVFCMAYEEERETLVVIGGTMVGGTGYGLSTEVWELVGGTWRRSPVSTPVGARALCSAEFVPSIRGVLLYGSEHAGWNDVWLYR